MGRLIQKEESIQQRLWQYRAILEQNPPHLQALEKSIARQNGLSDYDRIFLHIFAPSVTSFAKWALDKAHSLGIRRLYFLARDGWLLQYAAEILAEDAGYDFEMRYLKVSRYSLRRAQYRLLGEKCVELICIGGIDISFQKMMKRAALTEEEARHVAELAGFGEQYLTPLNYTQIQELKKVLAGIPAFLEYVRIHSEECYDNTIGYLTQEGMLEEIPYALVDSGWTGTIQMSLQQLVSAALGRERKMEGFYFGLYELPPKAEPGRYHGYYLTPKKGIRRKVKFSVCLFETVCSSPAGMTLGYEKKGERYLPRENGRGNPNQKTMERNRELLGQYLHAYTGCLRCGSRNHDVLFFDFFGANFKGAREDTAFVEKLLKLCMGTPVKEEALLLGELLFCDDVLELQLQKVAADWDISEIKNQRFISKILIKLNRKKEKLKESGWPEGSIAKAGGTVRENLRQERMYKYFMYVRKALCKSGT